MAVKIYLDILRAKKLLKQNKQLILILKYPLEDKHIKKYGNYDIGGFNLEYFGICPKCQNKKPCLKIININYDEEKISKSIISCEFSRLSKMEDDQGFEEISNSKFFRKGTKDSWKNDLDRNLRKNIEENFKDEMIELGYL